MTKLTIADTQTIRPTLSAPYIGDLMTQFDHAISQPIASNGDTMSTIDMTFQEFLNAFTSEGQALYYIDNILAEGRIEVSENTLPHYTWNGERFIAYADHHAQTHSFSMRIQRWYEDDDSSADAVITFDRSDNGCVWFFDNLHSTLSNVTEESEMHWEDTPKAHRMREIDALHLQCASYERRINATRRYLIESGAVMSPAQFEENCKHVANLRNMANAATERIEYLID